MIAVLIPYQEGALSNIDMEKAETQYFVFIGIKRRQCDQVCHTARLEHEFSARYFVFP